jgi:hypothetical protein
MNKKISQIKVIGRIRAWIRCRKLLLSHRFSLRLQAVSFEFSFPPISKGWRVYFYYHEPRYNYQIVAGELVEMGFTDMPFTVSAGRILVIEYLQKKIQALNEKAKEHIGSDPGVDKGAPNQTANE